MIPCLNTRLLYREDLPTKIRLAREAGYPAVELWVDEIREYGVHETNRLLNDNTMLCPTIEKIEGWWENDGELMGVCNSHRDIMAECRRRMEIGREINAPYIIACPIFNHRGKTAGWDQGVDYFRELLDIGRRVGCMPTLEFMGQTGLINCVIEAMEFLSDVNDRDATMVVDAYHCWKGPGSIEDFAMVPPDLLSVVHVSDANPLIRRAEHRDRDRIMPGDGCINLKRFFDIAKKKGYRGFVSLGVYNPMYWDEPAAQVAAMSYVKTEAVIT